MFIFLRFYLDFLVEVSKLHTGCGVRVAPMSETVTSDCSTAEQLYICVCLTLFFCKGTVVPSREYAEGEDPGHPVRVYADGRCRCCMFCSERRIALFDSSSTGIGNACVLRGFCVV